MRVMFDTNVVLDLVLDCAPFVGDSALVTDQAVRGKVTGLLCATTVRGCDTLGLCT
ncbi:MAG: hypothetical protein RLZZ401_345 [Pseudomonadota bacterium]